MRLSEVADRRSSRAPHSLPQWSCKRVPEAISFVCKRAQRPSHGCAPHPTSRWPAPHQARLVLVRRAVRMGGAGRAVERQRGAGRAESLRDLLGNQGASCGIARCHVHFAHAAGSFQGPWACGAAERTARHACASKPPPDCARVPPTPPCPAPPPRVPQVLTSDSRGFRFEFRDVDTTPPGTRRRGWRRW